MPVLVRYLTRDIRQVRHNVSLLYYVNSFGAVAGCLLAGLFLIRSLGITASNYLAAGLSMGIGVAALFFCSIQGRVNFAGKFPDSIAPEVAKGEKIRHGVKVTILLTAMAFSLLFSSGWPFPW